MKNRFIDIEENLNGSGNRFVATPGKRQLTRAHSKKSKCTQFSEIEIDADAFVLDVLQFFFDERLEASQLNDDLRDIAARALWKATEGSEAMDMVPRPPSGKPGIVWLISQAVQIGFRRAQNKCIYEAVRRTVKLSMRSEYEIAKNEIMSQSLSSDTAALTTSTNGIAMIKKFEGFRKDLYNDAAGHCTIGYGHLVHRGNCDGSESDEFKSGISEARATELLQEKVSSFENTVNNKVKVSLTPTQFDSLVSFTYNVGPGNFGKSTLLKRLNQGKYDDVPSEMKKWVYADGKKLQGLINRREAEAKLFKDGEYPETSSSQSLFTHGLTLADVESDFSGGMQAAVDWCRIRHSIIRSAVEVQSDWYAPGTTNLRREGHPDVFESLVMFWRDGVGMSQSDAERYARWSAADDPNRAFWSAAFISWCVRNAISTQPGASNGGFEFHARHMVYIATALRNREAADATRPFWFYDINDANIRPEHGDIICRNRRSNGRWTNHTYAGLRNQWVVNNPHSQATGSSHCDIIVGEYNEGGRRWIQTIGGNTSDASGVDDTVGSRYYSLDANGRIQHEVGADGTGILHRDVTQTIGARTPRVFGLIRLTACPHLPN